MATHGSRPVFLNLLRIRQSVPALASILHRAGGLVLIVAVPVSVYLLDVSLRSPSGFERARALLDTPAAGIAAVVLAWALGHHGANGVRLLLGDLGLGISLPAARAASWLSIGVGLVCAAVVAGAIW